MSSVFHDPMILCYHVRYQIAVKWKTPSDINSADNSGISFGVQNLPLGITGCRKDLVHETKPTVWNRRGPTARRGSSEDATSTERQRVLRWEATTAHSAVPHLLKFHHQEVVTNTGSICLFWYVLEVFFGAVFKPEPVPPKRSGQDNTMFSHHTPHQMRPNL